MPKKYHPPFAEDLAAVRLIREQLTAARMECGATAKELSVQLGKNTDFLGALERGGSGGDRTVPRLSTLQLWASVLERRIEFMVEDLWLFPQTDQEFLLLFRTSRPWGAHRAARLTLVASLRQWRMHRRLDTAVLAPRLGMSVDSVNDWENEAHDPFLGRAMAQARVMGTRVTLRLFTKDEWIFG